VSKAIHAYVQAKNHESSESLLRRFNLELQKSGILQELKEHEHYEKPSVKKRRKRLESKFKTDF
jgi:small subunit ribosomal protein S21